MIPDLSPFAVQMAAIAGILGSLTVIWRTVIKPTVEAVRSLASTAERVAALAAPDPTDPEGRPAIVNATAQIARQGHRTERELRATRQALREHDDQDWAVFTALEKAWNEDESHTSRLTLPPRAKILESE